LFFFLKKGKVPGVNSEMAMAKGRSREIYWVKIPHESQRQLQIAKMSVEGSLAV